MGSGSMNETALSLRTAPLQQEMRVREKAVLMEQTAHPDWLEQLEPQVNVMMYLVLTAELAELAQDL